MSSRAMEARSSRSHSPPGRSRPPSWLSSACARTSRPVRSAPPAWWPGTARRPQRIYSDVRTKPSTKRSARDATVQSRGPNDPPKDDAEPKARPSSISGLTNGLQAPLEAILLSQKGQDWNHPSGDGVYTRDGREMTSWMADTVSRRDEAASQPAPARSRLEEVYLEHAAAFGRLAFLLTGNAQVAEDIVQEAFVRAFARLMHLRRHDTLESYLRRTVVNLTRKHWRRSKRERAYLAREARSGPRLTHQPDV